MTSVLRAHAAAQAAGLAHAGRLIRATNSVNEVWFIGPYVLRINPHPEQARLLHERDVLAALPADLPIPELVSYGVGTFGEWLVVRRVPGEQLSRIWLDINDHVRERSITRLGHALRQLHAVDFAGVGLKAPSFLTGDSLDCPHQLPAGRLLDLLSRAALLPFVDRGVIRSAVDLVFTAADALDDEPTALVHGDLHFENVLCDGFDLTGIIDFEWTRPGPPDLDLDVMLHSLADPALHVAADYTALPQRSDFDHVTSWLREAYPELFSHPRLPDRLLVYRLSYDTRAMLAHPPTAPPDQLSPHHPYRRLQRVVEGRSDLAWILAG